nr:DUF2207 domain-containing protein [bacterium]
MRSWIRGLAVWAALMGAFLFGMPGVQAQDIGEELSIGACILQNGDVAVVECIRVRAGEDINGFYRTIDAPLDSVSVFSYTGNDDLMPGDEAGLEPYRLVEGAEKGDKKVYTLERQEGATTLMVYAPTKKGQSLGLAIAYTLKGAATAYADCGELYWDFVGSRWEIPLQHIGVRIAFEGDGAQNGLHAFGHGQGLGLVDIQADEVLFTVPRLEAGQGFEVRLLFDRSLVPGAEALNQAHLQQALEQEASWAEQANARLERLQKGNLAARIYTAAGVLTALLTGLLIYAFYTRPYRLQEQPGGDFPGDMPPALVAYLMRGTVGEQALSAGWMGLIDKGAVVAQLGDGQQARFAAGRQMPLMAHESFLRSWLLGLGGAEGVTMQEIARTAAQEHEAFLKDYTQYVKLVDRDAQAQGWYEKAPRGVRAGAALGGILFAVGGCVLAGVFDCPWALACLPAGLALAIYGVLAKRKSLKGQAEHAAWHAWRKKSEMCPDKGGEKELVYAKALGIPDKTLRLWEENIIRQQPNGPFYAWLLCQEARNDSPDGAITDGLVGAVAAAQQAQASANGSGGGFSSGGGGAGGGGGGGTF